MKQIASMPENGEVILSVISPAYGAEDILPELVSRLHSALKEVTPLYEIILVDDRSPDNSWKVVKEHCEQDSRVKGVRLSKNSGQQKAIIAGLQASTGKYAVVMDCDLQEDTHYIKQLYDTIQNGYDAVLTKRQGRKFSWYRNSLTRIFYMLLTFLARSEFSYYDTGMLSIMNRKVVDAMLKINSKNWFFLPVLSQVGFEKTYLEITHNERFAGKSSYSFRKLYLHGINLILSYSNRLLHFSIAIGMLFVLCAMIWVAYLIVVYYMGNPPGGYTSIMVTLLLCTGIILLSVGVVGLYIGKIFDQSKNSPDFFIDEAINL